VGGAQFSQPLNERKEKATEETFLRAGPECITTFHPRLEKRRDQEPVFIGAVVKKKRERVGKEKERVHHQSGSLSIKTERN